MKFVHVLLTTDDCIGYLAGADTYSKQSLESCSTLYGDETEDAIVNAVDTTLKDLKLQTEQ